MTGPVPDAGLRTGDMDGWVRRFGALPDRPGQRVHLLFARLYQHTEDAWLRALDSAGAPEFPYMVIRHFAGLYIACVPEMIDAPLARIPPHWRRFHWLARRLTMRSPISMHLLLLSLGARAHTRHDLRTAFMLAAQEHRARFGHYPDFDVMGDFILRALGRKAFVEATEGYIAAHHREQRGWRRLVLRLYLWIVRALRPVWLGVFQSWRRKAWNEAMADLRTAPGARPARACADGLGHGA